ncbi:MAG: hypothetical protein M1839_005663 [Geoglossum umbratile]|nr:MAG: hypothetical protein M1839_005663 [Geoglossum umbratile]
MQAKAIAWGTSGNEAESLARMLRWRDLREVLKNIQSPEFWEAERKYFKSSGCLEQRQNEEHVGFRKRNRIEQAAVGNDTAPKRRCLNQAQPLISEGGRFSLDSASSPLRRGNDLLQNYQKANETPVPQGANLATSQQLPAITSKSAASSPGTKSYGYKGQIEKARLKEHRNHFTPEVSKPKRLSKRNGYRRNQSTTRSVLSPIHPSRVSKAARKNLPPPETGH